jgi:putative endonuclease
MKTYSVYFMSGRTRTLYVGVTNDIEQRVYEHRSKSVPGFTSKYRLDRLVYFEEHADIRAAIEREKQIKSWRREKKVALIESLNPGWRDLSLDWQLNEGARGSDKSLRVDPSTPLGVTETGAAKNAAELALSGAEGVGMTKGPQM